MIRLVCLAVARTLMQLGRRLQHAGGGRAAWHLQRTAPFWIVGILNTAFGRPEHVGAWRTWVGAALLVIALADTIALIRKETRRLQVGTQGP